MADIFFTYAPEDAPRAAAIAQALQAHGLSVDWTREILPGQNRVTEMTRRLNEARAVVVLWSARSAIAPMVLDEAGAARDQGKLVPVMIERIDPPLGFRQLHTSDLSAMDGPDGREQIALLAQALQGREAAPGAGAARSNWSAPPHTAMDGPAPPTKFLWTRSFWSGTGLVGLVIGLVWFLTPDSEAEMGSETADRIGYLMTVVIVATIFIIAGRILLHVSRKLVGKSTTRYFDREYLVCLGLGLGLGFLFAVQPDEPGTETGFVFDLVLGVTSFPIMAGVVLLMIRMAMHMVRGAKR